jgi:hypothetical protein
MNLMLRADTCPWMDFTPGTVSFCEERLCSWVAEPSNTWSSVGYVAMGLYLFFDSVKKRDARLGLIAAAQFLIGVGSIFFHASGTFLGESIDQMGMFMLSCLLLAFAFGKSPRGTAILYVLSIAASMCLLLLIKPIGIILFSAQLNLGIFLHVRRAMKQPAQVSRWLYRGLGVFGVSFFIWILDFTKVLCSPSNHLITGHAVWHVLNAISISFLYRYFASIDDAPALKPLLFEPTGPSESKAF